MDVPAHATVNLPNVSVAIGCRLPESRVCVCVGFVCYFLYQHVVCHKVECVFALFLFVIFLFFTVLTYRPHSEQRQLMNLTVNY